MHHHVIHQPASLNDALSKMGLSVHDLHRAVSQGARAVDDTCPEDPPMFSGVLMWAHTVRALRIGLAPLGWIACDRSQFARTVSPDGRQAIVVAGGDSATGCAQRTPNVRSRKGPATLQAVNGNRQQLSLPFLGFGVPRLCLPWSDASECLTWILLIRRHGVLAYSELSLPAQTLPTGRVAHWDRRLVLPPIHLVATMPGRTAPAHSEPANDTYYAGAA